MGTSAQLLAFPVHIQTRALLKWDLSSRTPKPFQRCVKSCSFNVLSQSEATVMLLPESAEHSRRALGNSTTSAGPESAPGPGSGITSRTGGYPLVTDSQKAIHLNLVCTSVVRDSSGFPCPFFPLYILRKLKSISKLSGYVDSLYFQKENLFCKPVLQFVIL